MLVNKCIIENVVLHNLSSCCRQENFWTFFFTQRNFAECSFRIEILSIISFNFDYKKVVTKHIDENILKGRNKKYQ